MRTLSLKGIGAGVLAALALSIPINLVFGYAALTIFNDLAPVVNFANEAQTNNFISQFLSNPLIITYGVIAVLIGAGVPAYIAAWVAGRSFVLHSLAIGSILCLLALFEMETFSQFPSLFVLLIILTMLVTYAAGMLRKRQVASAG
jgi:hypothetical protein